MSNWIEQAACATLTLDESERLFFARGSRDKAIAFCAACPVQFSCLQFAHTNEAGHTAPMRAGIYGGQLPAQRARQYKAVRC